MYILLQYYNFLVIGNYCPKTMAKKKYFISINIQFLSKINIFEHIGSNNT